MGKSYRYSPDNDDYGFQQHRIDRRDIDYINYQMAAQIKRQLPPIRKIVVLASLLPEGWIPPKSESLLQGEVRENRLELLQTLGEMMLDADAA
jgi:hypothetical protein